MSTRRARRVLLLTRSFPSPWGGGTDLRHLSLIRALTEIGSVFVFGLSSASGDVRSDLAGCREASDPLAARPPEGAELAEVASRGESPFGTRASETTEVELIESVRSFVPDIVVICGLELARYVEVLRPHAPHLVLELDYARSVAFDEMALVDRDPRRRLLWRHAAPRVARTELRAVRGVDQVWVCSGVEPDRLRAVVGSDVSVAVVPNAVDVPSYPTSPRDDPAALVYPGRFDYWPNEDAARFLVDEVVPRVGDVRLSLVGRAPPEWLRGCDDSRIVVTGPVPDVRPYLAAAAAMPVPLSAGAGTRVKVLEAFAAGVPVVSTAKGVEGLDVMDGTHYVRAEDADEFVEMLQLVRRDGPVARRCVVEGRRLVERDYSLTAVRSAVSEAVAGLVGPVRGG